MAVSIEPSSQGSSSVIQHWSWNAVQALQLVSSLQHHASAANILLILPED